MLGKYVECQRDPRMKQPKKPNRCNTNYEEFSKYIDPATTNIERKYEFCKHCIALYECERVKKEGLR